MRNLSPARFDALRQCLLALEAAGVKQRAIALAFGICINTVSNLRCAAGVSAPRTAPPPIDGETWVDLPHWDLRVSSMRRVARISSGLQVVITKGPSHEYVTAWPQSGKTTLSFDRLFAEAFGAEWVPFYRAWSDEELAALKRSRTMGEAVARIPQRSLCSIKAKARALGQRMQRTPRQTSSEARGSVPYLEPIWAEAHAVVPRGIPDHVRDDLISDLVLMRLEGDAPDMRAALKVAIRSRNALMGTYREVSLDAPIPGTDGLRRVDVLASDAPHW